MQWQVTPLSCAASQAQESFAITNTGTTSIALSSITLKFWIDDTTGQTVVPHVWTGGCITGVNGNPSCSHQISGATAVATTFSPACGPDPAHQANWEVAVSNTDKTVLPPGATWSGLQVAINLSNYSNFAPGTNAWYSACTLGSVSALSQRYAVYVQGTAVSGAEPPSCRRAQGSQVLAGTYIPAAVATAPFLGPLSATSQIQLSIGLPLRNPRDLQNSIAQVSNPQSPNYRRYLTPSAFGAAYGPTSTDYESLITFATSNGLSIVKTYGNNQLLDVMGTVANIQSAFHVFMNVYQRVDGGSFYAPDANPSVDTATAILRVHGLDNFHLPARADGTGDFNLPFGSNLFLGADFRSAYVPGVALTGTGQTLALVEFDGFAQSDISAYENSAVPPLPSVPVTPVLIDGTTGRGSGGDFEVEVALDIEMGIAMAPGLDNIYVYEGPTPPPELGVAYDVAADDVLAAIASPPPGVSRSNQISCSWIDFGGENVAAALQQFAMQGQSFFMASGDSGAYVGSNTMLPPFRENESIYMTLVGGTELFTQPRGGAWVSERTWNDAVNHPGADMDASGGGVSTGILIPSYQAGIAAQITTAGGDPAWRNFPDVSMDATEIQTSVFGAKIGVVGTSAAAPLWAAFAALANEQATTLGRAAIGFANPAIYAIGQGPDYAEDFHDIVDGSNSVSGSGPFRAIAGYDLATGWGSPTGMSLIDDLAGLGLPCVNVANGTACGADEVCDNGRCVACTDDIACVPTNPCHAGKNSCATGVATCIDTGVNVPDGPTGSVCIPSSSCSFAVSVCTAGILSCYGTGCGSCVAQVGACQVDGLLDSNGTCNAIPGAPQNCGPCSAGVGACQAVGFLDGNGDCNAVPGIPDGNWHTTPARNGSFDWDCDGRTEQEFRVALAGSPFTCDPPFDGGFCAAIGTDGQACNQGNADNLGEFYFPCSGTTIICGERLFHQQCFFSGSKQTCQPGANEVVALGCR